MPLVSRISALFCGVSLGLLFFAGSDATARVTSLALAGWTPPTPAEGRLQTAPGDALRFNLAALAQDAPGATITINAAGVPPGATFRTTPGNPVAAGFIWVPRPAQAGRTYSLTFTAQPDDQAVPPRTRRVDVHVVARKAVRFALSSGATAMYRWAFVIRRVVARSAPSRSAAPVARLRLLTPENTTNLVQAIEGRRTASGVWVRVRLPVLPNNSTGWVPRRTLGNWRTVRTHLLVDRRRLTMTLYRVGRPVFWARVGVGRPQSPTPAGQFYVRNMLYGFDAPVYGPVAFGTSARSPVLTDWPGGGFIGIHGTNEPGLLPGRVSHGCVRLRNADMLRLARILPVGTPMTIR
jgi:lipoprotein-anchoring transpeptidase ErfK/SrfK